MDFEFETEEDRTDALAIASEEYTELYNQSLDSEEAKRMPEEEFEDVEVLQYYELILDIDGNDAIDRKLAEGVAGMADIIKRGNHFATDGFSGELCVFMDHGDRGGTYIEASQSIELAIRQISKLINREEIWARVNRRREVYSWINVGLPRIENPEVRNMNVANGLINLAPDGQFIAFHDSWCADYLTTTKLAVYYDPEAKCPTWEKFVTEIFPRDSQQVAWQLAALLMIPLKNKAASAIILKGEKNTGKSTFQNGLIAFLGHENVSSLSIDRFGERFQDTQLKGKLANIVGEMPNTRLTNRAVNVIKKLIGNDWLSGEIKGGASFKFLSYARCLFSCNEMPSCDSDEAFFDRFIIIPFKNQFNKDPVNEKHLNEALTNPEELSGLLNKALEALPTVIQYGIESTKSMKDAHGEVVENNDNLIAWFKEYLEFGPLYSCLFKDIHNHYKSSEPNDRARHSDIAFGRALRKLLPNEVVKKQRVLADGSRPYGYVGMRLIEQGETGSENDLEFDLENLDT